MKQTTRTTLISTLFLSLFLMTACSSDKGEEAAKKAGEVKDAMTESAKEMVDTAKETASEAVENVTEQAKETVAEVTESVTEKATDAVEAVTEKAEETVAAVTGSSKGKETYDVVCFACHAQGIAGAPKVGDKEAWTARVEQGNDTLYDHAINGYTGPSGAMMPAKGGRVDIADDDIKAAVDFMVAESK